MNPQMTMLLRVKHLRQEEALRRFQVSQAAARAAQAVTEAAAVAVDESRRTMGAREDRIYDDILQRVVDPAELEETRGRVVRLQKEHDVLVDDRERALHVEARAMREADAANAAYRAAAMVHDKYKIITDEIAEAHRRESDHREEVDMEDTFRHAPRSLE